MTQVPPPVPPSTQPSAQPPAQIPVCYRHPKRETYVRCTRCDRPICPECMNEASVGHQCPECVAEGRRTQRSVRTAFGGTVAGAKGRVTNTLIALNVLVLIASAASARGRGMFGGGFGGLLGGVTPLTERGAVKGLDTFVVPGTSLQMTTPSGVADGEYYRLFTQMFVHYGLIHLLVNMWALWILGRLLEEELGSLRFAMLYLMAGLGGGVAAYVFSPAAATAGASGAIFGLFAGLFIIMRRLGRDTSGVVPILVINIVISFVPGISLAGHLGGLVTGAIVAFALAYAPRKIRNLALSLTVAGLLALMVLAVALQTVAINSSG